MRNNFNKTEFIAINRDQKFHINIKENVTIEVGLKL